MRRQFLMFQRVGAVGLDEVLRQIPTDVEPQDVTLVLMLRNNETPDVTVNWEDPA